MNKRTKQFYKQWTESYDSILYEVNQCSIATEEEFYDRGKYIDIFSISHGFSNSRRVYVETIYHEHNYVEYIEFNGI